VAGFDGSGGRRGTSTIEDGDAALDHAGSGDERAGAVVARTGSGVEGSDARREETGFGAIAAGAVVEPVAFDVVRTRSASHGSGAEDG
jgi:hypothetical protein